MTKEQIAQQIFADLIRDLFDVPIMGNLYRPHYVERMVTSALGDGFVLKSADWAGWDIEYQGRVRIEVKQSAARQTWSDRPSLGGRVTVGGFDIAPRTGYWEEGGSRWVLSPGRPAHLYVLAWHPIADKQTADHRDPTQWLFFAVPTGELPAGQKRIARRVVERRWAAVLVDELREATLGVIDALSAGTDT